MKTILVPIAHGVEELEAITIIDLLRRGGLSVRVSTIEEREIRGAHSIKIVADSDFIDETVHDYDAIVLPGGSLAAESFSMFSPLITALKDFNKNNKIIGAICASSAEVLAKHKLLDHVKATCYPSYKDKLKNYVDAPVVVDKNIVTSQGPGTAILFALKLIEILNSSSKANTVAEQILWT